jgi:hypothetical protein
VREYGRWLLDGDVEVALALLRRIAAQAVRTGPFPPPQDYRLWSDDAVDELLVEMIAKKGGVAFLLGALAGVDNQGSAERYLLAAVQNFQKDQAKATAHGKLRERLKTVLGQDSRFAAVTQPDHGWRLSDGPDQWWQGDLVTLHCAALRVRGVFIPSWNTAGPTPRPAREALTTVAVAVLTEAGGTVRAEDLAQVLLERFRHEIAPESASGMFLDDVDEQVAQADQEPEHALAGISAEQMWARLTAEQRAIVPHLTTPEDAAVALGIGPREAAARRAQVIELVRLTTVDDPRAEAVVTALLDIASLRAGPATEMARLSPKEPPNTEGRMNA